MPPSFWSSLVKKLGTNGSISTAMVQSNPEKRQQYGRNSRRALYMACGLIFVSTSLGLLTARHELFHAPNVLMNKKNRKEIPEVEEPGHVLRSSEKFIDKSLFRRLGKFSGRYDDITRAKSNSSATEHHKKNKDTHK